MTEYNNLLPNVYIMSSYYNHFETRPRETSLDFLYIFSQCLLGVVSILRPFFIDTFWLTVDILSLSCPYYRACLQEAAQARSAPPGSATHKWSYLLYRPTY